MTNIVMTGGTAGIGLAAADLLRRTPGVRLLIGARGKTTKAVESLPLDLTRLDSVRTFAAAVIERLGDQRIDALVLNAGMQVSDVKQRTEDGFEITFAVNHLAHYLLLRLLAPRLDRDAIVVITTSNLHDARTNPIAPPEHADAAKLAAGQVELATPQGSRAAVRAYAASKLCNVLTARAFAESELARERGVRVIAFNPGLTPGTRLTRNHPTAFRIPFRLFLAVLGLFQRMNTVSGGGHLLADLTLGRISPPESKFYGSQVKRILTWPEPAEAASSAVAEKLWRDSAVMVGLSEPM